MIPPTAYSRSSRSLQKKLDCFMLSCSPWRWCAWALGCSPCFFGLRWRWGLVGRMCLCLAVNRREPSNGSVKTKVIIDLLGHSWETGNHTFYIYKTIRAEGSLLSDTMNEIQPSMTIVRHTADTTWIAYRVIGLTALGQTGLCWESIITYTEDGN